MLRCVPFLTLLALWPSVALAHDPSAWGGLFRSRDHGATWFPATEGRFVSGALAVALHPTDVNHILLATDSGLLRSLNGGRDWQTEAPAVLAGPVFAVAFAGDGVGALASTALGIYRSEDGATWSEARAPSGVAPARAIIRGGAPGRAYLAGSVGLLRTDDWGASWTDAAGGLPDGAIAGLVVRPDDPETIYAVAGGRLWASADGARTWNARGSGLPEAAVETVAADAREPDRLWAAGADQVYRSDDRGRTWRPVGRRLTETGTAVHGVAADPTGRQIVLTTHRGLYRSADGGRSWELLLDNLPAHLEAGPLLRDPADPLTLYAGFSLTPYAEIMRMAVTGETLLDRLDAVSIAGGVAFLVILGLGGAFAVRWLHRHSRTAAPAAITRGGAGRPAR